jgi:two-component system sensor histidine kinase TctE
MASRSLRGHLLRLLLPPLAGLLGLGAVAAYFASLEPASDAYDQALIDIGLALGDRIRAPGGRYGIDLPGAADRVLRTDRYDSIYYQVRDPAGVPLAGDTGLPAPPEGRTEQDGTAAYDGDYRGQKVRVVMITVPCEGKNCTVQVAETTNKRRKLAREIVISSLVPEILIVLATLVIVWFGVKRGLAPLEGLSREIKARSARDLRAIDIGHAPDEAKPLVGALNQVFEQVAEAGRNQQRFLANAAHQLRTPLAGLQAHTELALAQPVPESVRAGLEQVHSAAVRTARLANQLLALARAEPGGYRADAFARLNLRRTVEEAADEWVRRALARKIDLGFELEDASVLGDEFLLREAFVNLVHNAIEYAPAGSAVTARTGTRDGRPFLEVEDNGPGIPSVERERVLERFYRVPGSIGSGSGLGLAILHDIAQAHGAEVEIGDGVHGRGCRVALRFRAA